MDKNEDIIVIIKNCRRCMNAIVKDNEVVKCSFTNGYCIPIIGKIRSDGKNIQG